MIGTTLDGKYRIDRLVGAGAMGAVYEAEHTHTGRRVAIKVVSSGDVAHDKKLVARFSREAKAAGAIDTQHITQVLDAGVDEAGAPFLVMELLHGEDLQSAIKRLGPLPPDLALRIVAQSCLGLHKAHEAGVVHRDIKPANLFLARRDAGEILIKLLDFGIAKVKMDHASETENMALTKTGSMLGSPRYMSPEQAKGLKTIDRRADIWSLGVVLYQALTGMTPYDHCDALGGLIIAICHEDIAPVTDLAPWVAPEVADIVHKAIQRDPNARFQTAAEFFEAVKPLIPGGYSVNQEMLMPLSDTQKAAGVRKLSVPPPGRSVPPPGRSYPPPPGRSIPPPGRSIPPPALGGAKSLPPPPALPSGVMRGTNTGVELGRSDAAASTVRSPGQSAGARLLAGAAVTAVLAVGGLWVARSMLSPEIPAPGRIQAAVTPPPIAPTTAPVPPKPPAQPVPMGETPKPPAQPVPMGETPKPPAQPVVTPSATATEAPHAAPKRVKVVILPSDASAEIAGAKAAVRDGLLEITGVPGSVHRVRVWKGKREATVDVTITESGPSPTKIDLASEKH